MYAMIVNVLAVVAVSLAITGAATAGTYADAMKQCGAEWKASDTRKSTPRGEGAKAWQTFRAECTKRVGYDTKKGHVGN